MQRVVKVFPGAVKRRAMIQGYATRADLSQLGPYTSDGSRGQEPSYWEGLGSSCWISLARRAGSHEPNPRHHRCCHRGSLDHLPSGRLPLEEPAPQPEGPGGAPRLSQVWLAAAG